jgi:hypothetical protein
VTTIAINTLVPQIASALGLSYFNRSPQEGQGNPSSLYLYGSSEGRMIAPQAGQFFEYSDKVFTMSLAHMA